MSLKNILILFSFVAIVVACSTDPSDKGKGQNEAFVAVIDTSMTLMEIAKTNNIGEPYLRTQLGIKKGIGKKYTISEMAQRFDFEIDDLRRIIEDRKNKQSGFKPKTGTNKN